ncbi:MAG: cytochrome c oxidase assembly protein [Candidatus Sulfotelmatobacter sp.]
MTARQLLLSAWDWEPSIVIGCAALLALYFIYVRPLRLGRSVLFAAGVILLLLDLVSPIDALSDTYLFSVHMVQHLVFIFAVAPLFILGLPQEFAARMIARTPVGAVERVLSKPVIAWSTGTLTLAIWHIPLLYNLALAHEAIHIVQHLLFLITAVIFWWPVLNPLPELRLSIGPMVLYLFSAAMFNSILGMIITFAPVGWYPAYLHPNDELGILSLIRNQWRISPTVDQQLGGLLMWVPAGLIYFTMIVGAVVKWQSEADKVPFAEPADYIHRGRDA